MRRRQFAVAQRTPREVQFDVLHMVARPFEALGGFEPEAAAQQGYPSLRRSHAPSQPHQTAVQPRGRRSASVAETTASREKPTSES